MKNRNKLLYLVAFTTPLVLTLLVTTNVGGAPDKKKEQKMSKIERTASNLRYQELKAAPANAQQAVVGKQAVVHYTGWLNDGNDGVVTPHFDSSHNRGETFAFVLGGGEVIRGWDEGVALMKVGQKMRFYLPAALGYGSRGAGRVIPPNSDLIFDVELIAVR